MGDVEGDVVMYTGNVGWHCHELDVTRRRWPTSTRLVRAQLELGTYSVP